MKTGFLKECIYVGAGGIIGALLRHGTNTLFGRWFIDTSFITATTIENISGSLLIGIIFSFLSKKNIQNRPLNLFLLTGIIGSYTTYSGFMAEAFIMLQQSSYMFFTYLFSQVLAGIIAVWAGILIPRAS